MRHLPAALAWALLISSAALAQTQPILPLGIDNCTVIATVQTGDVIVAATETKSEKVRWLYTVLRTASGGTEYTVDASSLVFTGDHELLTTVTAAQIFDIVAAKTVMFGVAGGYATCSSTSTSAGVTTQSCVTRTSTGLVAAGTDLNRRGYGYTCSAVVLATATGTVACGISEEATLILNGITIQ
jgi:hypothetical protein